MHLHFAYRSKNFIHDGKVIKFVRLINLFANGLHRKEKLELILFIIEEESFGSKIIKERTVKF